MLSNFFAEKKVEIISERVYCVHVVKEKMFLFFRFSHLVNVPVLHSSGKM